MSRGTFQNLPKEKLQELASQGGKAAAASGKAHRFTSEQAREASLKRKTKRVGRFQFLPKEELQKIAKQGGEAARTMKKQRAQESQATDEQSTEAV